MFVSLFSDKQEYFEDLYPEPIYGPDLEQLYVNESLALPLDLMELEEVIILLLFCNSVVQAALMCSHSVIDHYHWVFSLIETCLMLM